MARAWMCFLSRVTLAAYSLDGFRNDNTYNIRILLEWRVDNVTIGFQVRLILILMGPPSFTGLGKFE